MPYLDPIEPRISVLWPLGIPRVGFGVGSTFYKPGERKSYFLDEVTTQAIRHALKAGFRHFDAAQMYNTEGELGEAIAGAIEEGLLSRDEVWITSKLDGPNHHPNVIERTLRKSLEAMQLTYIDLFLIHSPFKSDVPMADTWKVLEDIALKGYTKHIGVSNFGIKELEELRLTARIQPIVNQIEQHPHLVQPELVEYCKAHKILLESYTPLAPIRPDKPVAGNEELVKYLEKLAREKKTTPTSILLKWNLDHGNIVITTTRNPERMKEIMKVEELQLKEAEIRTIDELGSKTPARFSWKEYFPEIIPSAAEASSGDGEKAI